MKDEEHELLIASLNDDNALAEYKTPCDGYRPNIIPLILGKLLVFFGNTVYGRKPSYQKFKAVEVIARIPYQSWEVASYTFLTALYSNETKAIELAKTSNFSRVAQDNETMHVVVISQIVKRERLNNIILHSLIPLVFAFFYFWAVFILYAVRPRWALELNYLFEDHAFSQYDRFLKENEEELKQKNVGSEFLNFYGRHAINQYELFRSIRNDEIVHRNRSLRRALEL
jgi:hypothetical protein